MNRIGPIPFILLLYGQSRIMRESTFKEIVVVDFFLFGSFSFFVEGVGNARVRFVWRAPTCGDMVSLMTGTLNSCCMAPTGGLGRDCFAWTSGKPPRAVWSDLGNLVSRCNATGCRESSAMMDTRPLQDACPATLTNGGSMQ